MSKPKLAAIVKNTAIYSFGNLAVRLIGIVLIPIFTNTTFITVEELGAYSILEVGVQLLFTVMGWAVYSGFSRFYWDDAYKGLRSSMFYNSLLVTLIFTILIAAVAFALAEPINLLMFKSLNYVYPFRLSILCAGLHSIIVMTSSLLKLQSKSSYFSFINIVRALTTLGFTFLFVIKLKSGLVGIYHAQVLSLFIALAVALPVLLRNLKLEIHKGFIAELLKYSTPLMVSSAMVMLISILDKYVLSTQSGLEDVAVYSIGFKLANSIKLFVITSVQLALSPIIMKKMNDENHGAYYDKLLQMFSMGLMFIILTATVFGKELISIFTVDPIYQDAYPVFVILAMGFFIEMVKDNVVIGLIIEKKSRLTGAISLVIACVSLLMFKWLGPIWGIEGVAIAYVFVQVLFMASVYFFAQRHHPIPFRLDKVLWVFLTGVGLYLLTLGLNHVHWAVKYAGNLVTIAVYPFVLVKLGLLDMKELKAQLKEIPFLNR